MQTQLIRSRRSRNNWISVALALFVPLFLVLFMQHNVTKAQGEDPTATVTETMTETDTSTYPPTGMIQYTNTLTNTFTLVDTPTRTLTRTPLSITATRTPITPTLTLTRFPTDTSTPAATAIPPAVGSCPSIPYPVSPPLPGGRGLFPGSMSVTYFNDAGRMDYLLDNPINWGTLTAPSVSTWYLSSVDFAWNGQSPAPGVNGVFWSACFQGYLQVPAAGTYTFYLDNLDDGGVLYVGDLETPVISSWLVQGPHFYQADVALAEGITPIRLLYAQGPGTQSSVTLAWSSAYFEKEVIRGSTATYATLTRTNTPTPASPTLTVTNTPTDTPTTTRSKTPTSGVLPDLIISSVDYTSPGYDGQCLSGGYNPRLRVKVSNIGIGDAGPFVVDVNGTQLSVGGLAAGEDLILWFNRTGNLTITADINNSVVESNENNNVQTYNSPTPSRPPVCTYTPTITSSTLEITPTPTETKEITDTPSSTYTNTKSPTATPTSNREAHVRVVNASGEPLAGIPVSYIYIDGGSAKGASADNGITAGGTLTDSNGEVMFVFQFYPTVRFVATRHGREFWSGDCFVPARCFVVIHTPDPVDVTVLDSAGNPQPGLAVRAYSGNAYAGVEETTDAQGVATLWMPAGNYHFRAVKDGTIYWSSTQDHCVISGCTSATIRFNNPVTVTVVNLDGQPQAGVPVMVFDGTTFTDISGFTDAQGQVSFALPDGSYRFRAYKNNRFFWSGGSNHCAVPGCVSATITVDNVVVVTVLDSEGNPESGLNVLVYDGSTYAGYAAYTNAQGQATLSLPAGSYRFRVAKGGTAFWSGTSNHCTVPGCTSASITVNLPVVVTVLNLDSQPEAGLIVQAYNGSAWAGYTATTDAQGQVSFTLPDGNYRFRVYKNSRSFWSGADNHCAVPGCTSASVTVDNTVVVTVLDSAGNPESGLKVQAYNGSTFAGYSIYTDAQGRAAMTLPAGNYRFRVVKGGTAFWSGTADHCTVPGCSSAGITVNLSVTVTVLNLDGQPEAGISVVAYNGSTYAGYSGTTDAQGQVTFTMVDGSYRFRAAMNNRFFWSGTTNHCTVPGCSSVTITVDNTVVITVLDADGNPEAGLNVLAYNGSTYAGFAAYTNAQGQASLALPAGSYRFRVAKNGTAFWSGESNHCTVPGCANAGITTDGGGIALSNSMDIFGLAYAAISSDASIYRGRLEEYIPNPLFMYI